MNTTIKRISLLAMALLMLVTGVYVPLRNAEAAMTYNNTINAELGCTVNSNGQLNAMMDVTGYKSKTTHIGVELYVEKRVLGIFWSRVDIGCPNNTWTDSTSGYTYSHTFTTNLPSTGTYRVTVTYTVSGTGGSNDIIEKINTVSY